MAGQGIPGPAPHGERKQATVRLPMEHYEVYLELMERDGFSNLNQWISWKLADATGLEKPPYLHPARRRRAQQELPLAM